jgi:deoxycytidylate deaminase
MIKRGEKTAPPRSMIVDAERHAVRSPCAKSRRGVVLYRQQHLEPPVIFGTGFNGPPMPFTCPGRELCAGTCGKRCVHAEMRALRVAEPLTLQSGSLDLVHVKLGADGHVTPGGGPSCWQCSREILDVGFVGGVWLYEEMPEEWCPHIDELRTSCRYCQGDACRICASAPSCGPRCHDVLDRHHGLPVVAARWRYRTALEFHRVTLETLKMRPVADFARL